jgi:hypothetical protein
MVVVFKYLKKFNFSHVTPKALEKWVEGAKRQTSVSEKGGISIS